MDLQEGKAKFIESWGRMASEWGINRTMAQVHALLLISSQPLTADEVMEQLSISRGNANMNIRALIDWGLVRKHLKQGERKEFFVAEKEMWTVVRQIITHRKKKELEPMFNVLDEVSGIQGAGPDLEEFQKVVSDIKVFTGKANQTLDVLIKSDSNWFTNVFMRFIR